MPIVNPSRKPDGSPHLRRGLRSAQLARSATWQSMTGMSDTVEIQSRDYWVKVVEMLQQNWALIETGEAASSGARVFFIGDTSGVFDEMSFQSGDDAVHALRKNGFRRYADDLDLESFIGPPKPPFRRSEHPNGPIYSSGRYWRE